MSCLLLTCAEEQPLSPTGYSGKIVGVVKPVGNRALVELKQGLVLQTTQADSATGYFELTNVTAGVYNLEFSADQFGRQVINEIIVYERLTTTVPDIILKPLPEQILTISPATGATLVAVNSPICIEFAYQMNQPSVENNFLIYPLVYGYFEWENFSNSSTCYFYPLDQYETNETYAFTLTKQARTIYGDTLTFAITSYFKTEGLKLISTIPTNQANYISPQTGIYLTFNSNMNRQSVEDSLHFSPALTGNFKWLDSKRISVQPGDLLASNTQYIIYNLNEVSDIYNTRFTGRDSFFFTTEPLKIASNYPANGATQISRSSPIIITFNTYVNQESVENSFSINPMPASWYFVWTDLTRFQFEGTTQLLANTVYTLVIHDMACMDYWGNPLLSEYRSIFRTAN